MSRSTTREQEALDIDAFRQNAIGANEIVLNDYDFVQEKVLASRKRFWKLTDFPGRNPDRTHKAFKKLELEGEVIRIIRGLYWRGEKDEQNKIIPPTVYQITVNILDLSYGIGYSEKTAFEKLQLTPLKEAVADWEDNNQIDSVFIASPLRAPRRVPGAIVISRLGAKERINQKLNLLEATFLEALCCWKKLKHNKANNKRLQELLMLEENEEEVLGLQIRKDKLIKASFAETATVRDSLRNLFFSLDLDEEASLIMPARKRGSSPGWPTDF